MEKRLLRVHGRAGDAAEHGGAVLPHNLSCPSPVIPRDRASFMMFKSSIAQHHQPVPRIYLSQHRYVILLLLFFSLVSFFLYTSVFPDVLTMTTGMSSVTTTRRWDSHNSVVIGLAYGYGLDVYQTFVGSLRATGYSGRIVLGIADNASPEIRTYLAQQNVTTKVVQLGDCTYFDPSMEMICSTDYPEYKITWGRFALARDWLLQLDCQKGDSECTTDSIGVMLTDVRDAFFQRDPFEAVVEPQPLLVFEEHPDLTTENWLTDFPLKKCREYVFGPQPMLCSGSIMGSHPGVLNYIKVMIREFDYWNANAEQCLTDLIGDDQSIHNYIYYTNQLEGMAVAVPHRTGPIHVVGFEAAIVSHEIYQKAFDAGHGKDLMEAEDWVYRHGLNSDELNEGEAATTTWPRNWLPLEYNLTDAKTGIILNLDGSPSPQVHQFDRYGSAFVGFWLEPMRNKFWTDAPEQ